jgi:GNAT superfamily N-acetyltransferase
MKGITIRALVRSDLEEMDRLHRSRDDLAGPEEGRKRTELLEWLAFHNPYAGDEGTYLVAEDNKRLVAYQGRMPVQFVVGNVKHKGYYAHDTFVDPEYRKKGIGFALLAALTEATEKQSDSFFCLLGGTPLNLKIQRRMGFQEIPSAATYVKIIEPDRYFQRTIRIPPLRSVLSVLARTGILIADVLTGCTRVHPGIAQIERFDHRFDDLAERLMGKIGVCTFKSAAYLNWKYSDRPYKRDIILAFQDADRVRGFVVLSTTRDEGRTGGVILELVADPDDRVAVLALCRAAVRHFRLSGNAFVRCVMSDDRFGSALRSLLFLKSGDGKPVLLGNLNRVPEERDRLTDTQKWHVTLGETDAFMLNPP